ncbi:MAG: hypothetical protein ACYCZU_14035, partial [Devosia sp.]
PAPAVLPAAHRFEASPRRETARGKALAGFGGFAFERQAHRATGTPSRGDLNIAVEMVLAHGAKRSSKQCGAFYAQIAKSQ